ncbi:MAG: PHP domain-containing protein [Candidatus Methanofastidiosia archaeon]
MLVDLHVHTTASDGLLTPKKVLRLASEKKVKLLSITDHDNTSGIQEALNASKKFGVEVIPGVELSAKAPFELHILGYFFDFKAPELLHELDWLKESREKASQKMIERLNSLGFEINYEEVRGKASGVVGRPHIAEVLLEKGYISEFQEAFDLYIGNSKPAYVEKRKLQPKKCIKLIQKLGGFTVLAHPKYTFLEIGELERVLLKLKNWGLSGIEVYQPEQDALIYEKLADRLSLLKTAGTDFHNNKTGPIGVEFPEDDLREFLKRGES